MHGPSAHTTPYLVRREAFDLIGALDAYDACSTQLVQHWLDMELYNAFSSKIDVIREHGVSVPELTVLTLQLVIAHCELVSAMWQNASVGMAAARLREVDERHRLAIEALRTAAARILRGDS